MLEERRKGEQRNFNVAVSVSRCLPKKSNYYHSSSLSALCVCLCVCVSSTHRFGMLNVSVDWLEHCRVFGNSDTEDVCFLLET